MKDWKTAERRIAELLGGQRIPVTGRQRGDTPDIEHAALSIEVKSRKSLPAWVLKALNQVRQLLKRARRCPWSCCTRTMHHMHTAWSC